MLFARAVAVLPAWGIARKLSCNTNITITHPAPEIADYNPNTRARDAFEYNVPMKTQNEKAELFRSLHHGPEILVLPNAWDCSSARIFEQAGFPAIATTSAGIAFSLGYTDGERIPQDLMLTTVARICAAVPIPMTADLESGYGDVAKTTAGLIAAGAVGLNFEDMDHESCALVPIAAQTEKIAMIRRIAAGLGVNVVINARTDVFLAQYRRSGHALRARLRAPPSLHRGGR